MFLKALSIKGFKSFADPADLQLEPGITVVVGPNGSGKSNVVDAMAWVLGAQAPSAVRSQKMEDVIFAGTSSKKALGRAEVSLTIDNTDGELPVEFNEVMITRTLFRSGDSDYAINGVSCRLLDIQELLSDSGVGRQQHIIVSQGRIDDVLNARPEDRRSIIEEAAGVLKYRKRRERAERRLAATADNLNRLNDLSREVRRQIKPLERQAEAARRHGALITELRELKTHLAGRELSILIENVERGRTVRSELNRREGELATSLSDLDPLILQSEAELAALGASDIADVASRARSMAERIRGQLNVIGERRTRLDGELQAAVDDGLVANLEAESARITAELAVASAESDALKPEFADLKVSEAELTHEQLSFDTEWGESIAPSDNQAAEIRTRIEALAQASQRNVQELARFGQQVQSIDDRKRAAAEARDQASADIQRTEQAEPDLVTRVSETTASLERADAELAKVLEDQRQADAEASRWHARSEALSQALDEARSRAGVDALNAADGVLGTLLDLVQIDEGWEPAVEAAIGDALLGVVVDSTDNAIKALHTLDANGLAGGVVALGASRSPAPPNGLRNHVRSRRPEVEALLDTLLADVEVVQGSWRDSLSLIVEGTSKGASRVFVTREGDRFSPRGWRLKQGSTGATGAAYEEAKERATEASETAELAAKSVIQARETLTGCRRARAEADESLRQCRTDLERAASLRERANAEILRFEADRDQLVAERAGVFTRKQDDANEMRLLSNQLPALENEEAEQKSRSEALARSRTSLEERSKAVTTRRTELEVKIGAIEERSDLLRRRKAETEARLERLVNERDLARERRERIEESIAAVVGLEETLVGKQDRLAGWVELLEAEQHAQSAAARKVSDELSQQRTHKAQSEAELIDVRDRRSRIELNETEYRVKLEALTEALKRELDTDPEIAMTAECPELPAGVGAEARVQDLERELKIMGAINPLALEEYEELKERHEFLNSQLDDIKSTRRDLHKLIRSIDEEIVSVFSSAYADVAENFVHLFTTLFPGGKGAVTLTNGDDILNCGIDIEAKPSGKNVKKLSLLSGGERSLVALAFLFAVFRSRPSPFYVMDEVEAALDDMNLSRFLALVEEFRKEAQLIIVSHQKRTMEAADILYGVTMAPGGSSKVVTEKVEDRKAGRLPPGLERDAS